MDREGPAESSSGVAATPEARHAHPYGMQLKAAIIVIAFVVLVCLLVR